MRFCTNVLGLNLLKNISDKKRSFLAANVISRWLFIMDRTVLDLTFSCKYSFIRMQIRGRRFVKFQLGGKVLLQKISVYPKSDLVSVFEAHFSVGLSSLIRTGPKER